MENPGILAYKNPSVVGRIIPLSTKMSIFLNPITLEYFTLQSTRKFAGVIKLMILRWGNYLKLSRYAQYNHKGPP